MLQECLSMNTSRVVYQLTLANSRVRGKRYATVVAVPTARRKAKNMCLYQWSENNNNNLNSYYIHIHLFDALSPPPLFEKFTIALNDWLKNCKTSCGTSLVG